MRVPGCNAARTKISRCCESFKGVQRKKKAEHLAMLGLLDSPAASYSPVWRLTYRITLRA